MKTIELFSEITCPICGHRKTEEMPTNACQCIYPSHLEMQDSVGI